MNGLPADASYILLVDDNAKNLQVLGNLLKTHHYKTLPATSGKRALYYIEKHAPDLILLDVMMPEMDGFEVCKILKQQPETTDIPIIFLTAKTEPDSIVKGFELGAVDYVAKPFHAQELLARVKTHVDLKLAREALIRKNEAIRHMAITDPLTGCFNRGYLFEQFPREIRRTERYQRSLSVMLCDIDHFKQVNDTYGHQMGDAVLQSFVRHVQHVLRVGVDWIARYGGEEFFIVLPETEIDRACEVAERVRQTFAEQRFKPEPSGVNDSAHREREFCVTVSFGVTGVSQVIPVDTVSEHAFIRTADMLMYQAKEEGRNRVCRGIIDLVSS